MTAPVRCWLVYRGKRIDTFTTTVPITDPEKATAQLRRHLDGGIRAAGADPARHGADYSLDVARTDVRDPLVTNCEAAVSAQPADLEPRDAGPVRLLHAVPDVPREAPQRPVPPPLPVTDTPAQPMDRVAVTVLATPVGGLFVAWTGSLPVLAVWAVVWVALVVWTARGLTP